MRVDFKASRETSSGFNFKNLSYEFSDKKNVKIDGTTKQKNKIEIRSKDETKASVSMFRFQPLFSNEKSVDVTIFRK